MDLGHGLGRLTYSMLVHPADDWPQLWDSLQTYLPEVKQRISLHQPFGVCIRLSHLTAAELSSKKAERGQAFVYGVFKNTQIKDPERTKDGGRTKHQGLSTKGQGATRKRQLL